MKDEKEVIEYKGLNTDYQSLLGHMYYNVLYNNLDCLIVMSGREGYGKSTLAIHTWRYINHLRKTWNLPSNFNVNNIGLTSKTFLESIKNSNKGDVVMYDEAALGLYNRQSMKKSNTTLNQVLMICRYKNLFLILNIPDFMALDAGVRRRRVTLLCNVKGVERLTTHPIDGKKYMVSTKGYFDAYNVPLIQKINRTEYMGTRYPFTPMQNYKFSPLTNEPEWIQYEEHAKINKDEFITQSSTTIIPKKYKHKLTLDDYEKIPKLTKLSRVDNFDE